MNPTRPAPWLLTAVRADYNWDASDYLRVDELKGWMRDHPPFGSYDHRILSTILLLQAELAALKAL